MAFVSPFQTVFRPVFGGGAAAAVPWWLSGGILAANCIAAYTPKGAASLAASYDNNAAPGNGLPDGTYDAAPGVAPTFNAATGWTFGGGTYLTTGGITPPNTQTWSYIVRYSGATAAAGALFGSTNPGANSPYAAVWPLLGGRVYYGHGNYLGVLPSMAAGNLGIAGAQGYRNGAPDGGAIGVWAGVLFPIFIGAYNNGGGGVNGWTDATIAALAIYSVTNTAVQMAALTTAMAVL